MFILNYLFELIFSQTQQYIFWFEISVYHSTYTIQKVEAHENLPSDFFDDVDGQTFAVVLFEYFPEVDT